MWKEALREQANPHHLVGCSTLLVKHRPSMCLTHKACAITVLLRVKGKQMCRRPRCWSGNNCCTRLHAHAPIRCHHHLKTSREPIRHQIHVICEMGSREFEGGRLVPRDRDDVDDLPLQPCLKP